MFESVALDTFWDVSCQPRSEICGKCLQVSTCEKPAGKTVRKCGQHTKNTDISV